jgi:hypothetical protein
MRRGGPRREAADRVHLVGANLKTREGWALNISRGGIRVIVEERVELGEEYALTLGDGSEAAARTARVVWLQEEPDGLIVGLEFAFEAAGGAVPSSLPPPPDSSAP